MPPIGRAAEHRNYGRLTTSFSVGSCVRASFFGLDVCCLPLFRCHFELRRYDRGEFSVSERPSCRHPLCPLYCFDLFTASAGDLPGHYRQAFRHLGISKGNTRQVLDFSAFAASRNEAVAIAEQGVLADRLEVEGCECNSFTGIQEIRGSEAGNMATTPARTRLFRKSLRRKQLKHDQNRLASLVL